VQVFMDATTYYVRLRLDADPLQAANNLRPFGWGLLIDSNGSLNDYELAIFADGIRDLLAFEQNTTQGTIGDPSDTAEVDLYTEVVNTGAGGNVRVSAASSSFNGNGDFFLDFAIPVHVTAPAKSILDVLTPSSTVRYIAGTSNNGRFGDWVEDHPGQRATGPIGAADLGPDREPLRVWHGTLLGLVIARALI